MGQYGLIMLDILGESMFLISPDYAYDTSSKVPMVGCPMSGMEPAKKGLSRCRCVACSRYLCPIQNIFI